MQNYLESREEKQLEHSDLGKRMKESYENRTRYHLPRRSYQILRIDGRAFHTFTKGCNRPYDTVLMEDMNLAAIALCKEIQGAKLAYVQSDEISVVITDFDSINTEAWFDNNIQKMASVSASIVTSVFNQARQLGSIHKFYETYESDYGNGCDYDKIINVLKNIKQANFDSRVFTIADRQEVLNYIYWRQQDCTRNSISMAAQSLFSHKELQGKKSPEMMDMMMLQKGVNWNNYPIGFKRGRIIRQRQIPDTATFVNKKTQQEETVSFERSEWFVDETPIFTQNTEYLKNIIPAL